jgi:hypothetical protein
LQGDDAEKSEMQGSPPEHADKLPAAPRSQRYRDETKYVERNHDAMKPEDQAGDRTLVVVDSEAEIVRCIFRRYAELGSVRLLKEELEARGITSTGRTSASGRFRGGKPFARGALYLMLQNRIYRGEIVHSDRS